MEISETGNRLNRMIVYDGNCSFCQACVNFIVRHSPASYFKPVNFHTVGDSVRHWFQQEGLDPQASVIYSEKGKTYVQSTAVLKIARRMNFPYCLLYAFILVPACLRNALYRYIARHRHGCSTGVNPTC
jgi:predicted DCC family thiol-disulfide oxidoreductase YuxK